MTFALFDTHTHFDVADFDHDRQQQAELAKKMGVEHLILIGFVAERFADLLSCQRSLQQFNHVPQVHLAPGLHPFYIEQHRPEHLQQLEQFLQQENCVAIGEIGLDTFLKQHKQPELFAKQQQYFQAQIELAEQYHKPILLHIRKSHADVLKTLKHHQFKHGGIAHAFSGGLEEAKAFIQLGFKIGVTGQVSNPNAKKLHRVIQAIGAEYLVLETDCPDMTPLCCQIDPNVRTRNTPANLIYVLEALATSLNMQPQPLAQILWRNSFQALAL
jgi:TatD DNase family protein